jgi:hypothetical protein
LAYLFILLLVASVLVMPGLFGKRSPLTLNGSIAFADPSDPRSYSEFIQGAYLGALGRFPTCFEELSEFTALSIAEGNGTLQQEAQRFVSTLFETQASFNDSGGSYCQSSEYESLNPAFCNPFINTNNADFVTDLYHSFLLREPESAGFNDWINVLPTHGRKHVLNGFRFSVEFEILVGALYEGTAPNCGGGGGEPCPGSGGGYGQICP